MFEPRPARRGRWMFAFATALAALASLALAGCSTVVQEHFRKPGRQKLPIDAKRPPSLGTICQ